MTYQSSLRQSQRQGGNETGITSETVKYTVNFII